MGDTLGASESFLKRVNKLFADAVSLVEARALHINKRVAETVALTENLGAVRVAVKAVSDTLSLTETFVKRVTTRVVETVALTEARLLTVSRRVTDTLGLTEGLGAVRVRVTSLGETVSLTEQLAASIVPGGSGGSLPPQHLTLRLGMGLS
jgi:hypothetical protein